MFEAYVLIPVYDNEGTIFSAEDHHQFECLLAERFDGFSLVPSSLTGAWVNGGKTYHDELRAYVVALRSIAQGGAVVEVAQAAKAHYRQEAIYIRYLGVSEVI
ncbi:hypothetical protein LZC95_07850 [Pendulispora brunnea]|uniref:Uncharacterized protein n=1 Tax=Pendulispora brunnea TaxID=2905690 RepID=A0ABZ2KDH5_9BACT